MTVIFNPDDCTARRADSRPAPGPFINTETCRIPCSIAFFAASSPASWAANGVLFRDPLNPIVPAVAQLIVLPDGSVMVTTVLLNVD